MCFLIGKHEITIFYGRLIKWLICSHLNCIIDGNNLKGNIF